jgi:hypothetical protein
MRIHIRPAVLADAEAMFTVKQQIKLPPELDQTQSGGFLLGTSLEEYRCFIQNDIVLVAEHECDLQVIGFAIVMRHETLSTSLLMQRAEQVQWESAFRSRFNVSRLSFFEQLGMLPDPACRIYAKYLACAVVKKSLETHDALFTTVLRYPVYNTAALPFINVAGFEFVGHIDETYPEYGHIKSDVFCVERDGFERRTREGRFALFVEQARRRGYLQ